MEGIGEEVGLAEYLEEFPGDSRAKGVPGFATEKGVGASGMLVRRVRAAGGGGALMSSMHREARRERAIAITLLAPTPRMKRCSNGAVKSPTVWYRKGRVVDERRGE